MHQHALARKGKIGPWSNTLIYINVYININSKYYYININLHININSKLKQDIYEKKACKVQNNRNVKLSSHIRVSFTNLKYCES